MDFPRLFGFVSPFSMVDGEHCSGFVSVLLPRLSLRSRTMGEDIWRHGCRQLGESRRLLAADGDAPPRSSKVQQFRGHFGFVLSFSMIDLATAQWVCSYRCGNLQIRVALPPGGFISTPAKIENPLFSGTWWVRLVISRASRYSSNEGGAHLGAATS